MCCQSLIDKKAPVLLLKQASTKLKTTKRCVNNLTDTSFNAQITTKELIVDKNIEPAIFFTPLAQQPWAIWLDSCQSEHVDSRYDIMVWQPVITLSTVGEDTTICWLESCLPEKNRQQQSKDDPLTLLNTHQAQFFKDNPALPNNLPFNGGALGYFAYDLGRRFEQLPASAQQDINLPEMAAGIYNQAVIFDNKAQKYFLVCPEYKRQQTQDYLKGLLAAQPVKKSTFALTGDWQSNMDRKRYGEKFDQVQQYLLSGDCYQINLAQRFTAAYQGDEFDAYLALRAKNRSPFSAFMRFENAAILSVSPERFLQCKQGKVQSKPIKGTRPRSENSQLDRENAQALQNAIKDRAENLMIVDLLRNDISKTCQPGSVVVPKLFEIESFPAVHHLVSTVEGLLSPQFDASDLLRGAFPGGSITGAPKIRAMEIIEQLEPHRRSVYCGSIGYFSASGNMDTSITIRTLICFDNKIHCWAGGGIVADSKVDCEYQETFDKVNKILPVLSQMKQQN